MKQTLRVTLWIVLVVISGRRSMGQQAVPLPGGVKAVWDMGRAYRETTTTRERICINGLWRWQPATQATQDTQASQASDTVPTGRWGYFKVPGSWPGITNYMQKDSQTVYAHPSWRNQNLRAVDRAWYQREITIPRKWAGRRITLYAEYLNSYAVVYLDGKKVGRMRFPRGEVDITSSCRPGGKHLLSLLTVAMPLKAVMLSYNDTASARKIKGSVARRGLCGDVFLVSTPARERIGRVKVDTSVRKWEIAFKVALTGLEPGKNYRLRARVADKGRLVKEFKSGSFQVSALSNGRLAFGRPWKPAKLWDLNTPGNQYELQLSLLAGGGKVLDTFLAGPFGFREFWIEGRDFYLNGSRFLASIVPFDNAQIGAASASYEGARETMLRIKSFGVNTVYTHNYGCRPGSHLSFTEILRAADDVGLLVAFSQPHFGQYDWKAADAEQANGYAKHAEFYVQAAGNHPSVVMYAMSHNATGYSEDMNPDLIDGIHDKRSRWSANNVKRALQAEAIVKKLDPGRIVYHHSSGNLGSMHTSNFYLNFVPIQERSDWFEHWAKKAVKPVLLVEYGMPLSWNWTMYRGWYKGRRTFGSAKVPWEFCLAEWNSQFLGDRAYRISDMEKTNLRWEARQFRAGKLWHRWDYPYSVGSNPRRFEGQQEVWAAYITDNWRAYRTWGISGFGPWDFGPLWKLRDGVNKGRKTLKTDWDKLQRPGFSPDYIDQRYERMDLAFGRRDWVPTVAGRALIRNNRPLLAYIAGRPGSFTSKGHNFRPGQTVEKQIIVINNSRLKVRARCSWTLALPRALRGSKTISIESGQQKRIALRLPLPAGLAPGAYKLSLKAEFDSGETQEDAFTVHLLPRPAAVRPGGAKIALFDPQGETAKLLSSLKIRFKRVAADADLGPYGLLVVGKAALTVNGAAPDIGRVREGLKVVMFEQTAEVLEKRFGFRVQEYGLRRVFERVPDHPILAGLENDHLRDWQGAATILPPRRKYELRPSYGPTITRSGLKVTRPWRCGNRGNVASVLIEKPARGDFLPLVDGGYSLQYSPLLEYREGRGLVLLCQMDVTGRTRNDPAAETLARNLIDYARAWQPSPGGRLLWAGDQAGAKHLRSAGFTVQAYAGGELAGDQVLVVGPGGGGLPAHRAAIARWLKAGGRLLAVGLSESEANAFLPFRVKMKRSEYINTWFEPAGRGSLFAGLGPADVFNRDPRRIDLLAGGATALGNGVLAEAGRAKVVFCQLVPWQFVYGQKSNIKRTFRRTSCLLARLLGNMGVHGATPLLSRFSRGSEGDKSPWLTSFYLDRPVEYDDPYRFFRW